MKSIYEVSKRLVINEEIFVYISDGNLRYIEDKGDMYDTKEVVDVDYIRKMIIDEIIPWSKIKKSLIKKEEVRFALVPGGYVLLGLKLPPQPGFSG